MANFDPIGGAPFSDGDDWTALMAQEVSDDIQKTINASDGSSHANTGEIEFAGEPWVFTDTLEIKPLDNEVVLVSGATLTVAGTAIIDFDVNTEIRGDPTLVASTTLHAEASSTIAIEAGATVTSASTIVSTTAELVASLSVTTTPTDRKLIAQITLGASQIGRLYARIADAGQAKGGGFDITRNAAWNGTNWAADDTAAPAMITEFFGGPYTSGAYSGQCANLSIKYRATTTVAWGEGSWDSNEIFIGPGNPAPTNAYTHNTITAKSVNQCWGVLTTDGVGGVTIDAGIGIDSVAISGNGILVNMVRPMSSASYAVFPSINGLAGTCVHYTITDTDEFTLFNSDSVTQANDNLGAVVRTLSFHVLGEQA